MPVTPIDKEAAKAVTEALLKVLSGGDIANLDGTTVVLTVKGGAYELVVPSGPIISDDIS